MKHCNKKKHRQMNVSIYLILLSLITFTSQANVQNWLPKMVKEFGGVVVPSISIDSLPYKDVDTQIAPSVVIMGRSGQLFVEGNRVGYMLSRSPLGALSIVGQVRAHQYIPESDGFTTKDKAMELGLQLAKPVYQNWSAQLTVFQDISDTHQGQEIEFGFYRRDFWGDFRLLTLVALQQQSKRLTNYYAGYQDYEASADLNTELELIGVYDLTANFNITAVYRHYIHGNEFNNSPLTNGNQTQRLILGVGWTF